jgi:pimeloyl-ACP methyl ester carboxylesterase
MGLRRLAGVLPRARGAGGRSPPGLDVANASHGDYANRVVLEAEALPQPVCLCGWSMGGLAVLQAAVRVRPHSLVLLETSFASASCAR